MLSARSRRWVICSSSWRPRLTFPNLQNSRHIIGIPPSALFRATSLANLLPKDEIDSLLDAMDALDEREEDLDNTELGPIYFELSGFGLPGTDTSDPHSPARLAWDCYAALHRPSPESRPRLHILELELIDDQVNPLFTVSEEAPDADERGGMAYDVLVEPSEEELNQSTISLVKPLRALARIRNKRRGTGSAMARDPNETDFVGLLSQVNEQLARANDLKTFAKLTAGVFKEIAQVSRRFDVAISWRVEVGAGLAAKEHEGGDGAEY